MATDLTGLAGRVYLDVSMTAEKEIDLSTPTDVLAYRPSIDYTFGDDSSADGEADQIYHDTITIAASGNSAINLSTCLNPHGTACAFDQIKAVIIRNTSASTLGQTSILSVGGGTWDGWLLDSSDRELVWPGQMAVKASAKGIGPAAGVGAGETLLITNTDGANTATFDIIIIGTVAA